MPHSSFIKRLFKRKSSLAHPVESSTQKQSAVSSLQKFKVSRRSRVHTLRATSHTRPASPEHVVNNLAVDEFDLSQCLPVVDDI
jgi:hypothetical protein